MQCVRQMQEPSFPCLKYLLACDTHSQLFLSHLQGHSAVFWDGDKDDRLVSLFVDFWPKKCQCRLPEDLRVYFSCLCLDCLIKSSGGRTHSLTYILCTYLSESNTHTHSCLIKSSGGRTHSLTYIL